MHNHGGRTSHRTLPQLFISRVMAMILEQNCRNIVGACSVTVPVLGFAHVCHPLSHTALAKVETSSATTPNWFTHRQLVTSDAQDANRYLAALFAAIAILLCMRCEQPLLSFLLSFSALTVCFVIYYLCLFSRGLSRWSNIRLLGLIGTFTAKADGHIRPWTTTQGQLTVRLDSAGR